VKRQQSADEEGEDKRKIKMKTKIRKRIKSKIRIKRRKRGSRPPGCLESYSYSSSCS